MKTFYFMAAMLLILPARQNKVEHSLNNQNNTIMESRTAIETLLFTYRDALNTSDVNKVLTLYTEDGVFMPSNAPTSVGQTHVKGAYEYVFSTIQLNIEFYIDEIVINGNTAFARTTSKGTVLIHANGQTAPEENRELFLLQKVNGKWKIARYMFNKMS